MADQIQSRVEEIRDLRTGACETRSSLTSLQKMFESGEEELIASLQKNQKVDVFLLCAADFLCRGIQLSEQDKEEHFKKARSFLSKADRIEVKCSCVLKGFYFYLTNDFKQANDYFENSKENDAYSLSAHIGKGLIEYQRKNYTEALRHFTSLFATYRKNLLEAAYLMAMCYFQLGRLELCEKSLFYLQKNGFGRQGLVEAFLGVLYLRQKRYDLAYERLSESFARGREVGSFDLNTLLFLSEHYFYKKDFVRATRMAELSLKALEGLPSLSKSNRASEIRQDLMECRSRLLYILAFIHHSSQTLEEMNEAYRLYTQALENWPGNHPARFGLAQVYYYQRNYTDCVQLMEKLVTGSSESESRECFLLMANSYMRLMLRPQAQEFFEKTVRYFPRNVENLADFAGFLENSDPKQALKIYSEIQQLLKTPENSHFKTPFLLINISVSYLKNGEIEKAAELIKECRELLAHPEAAKQARLLLSSSHRLGPGVEPEELGVGVTPPEICSIFNESICLIRQGRLSEAVEKIDRLLGINPLLQECQLLLALIHLRLNQKDKALAHTEKALQICLAAPKLCKIENALVVKAHILIESREFQRAFEFVQKVQNPDSYIRLLKAKILYLIAIYSREDQMLFKKAIREAGEECAEVLKRREDEGNSFAAMNVAALLTERGQAKEALQVLGVVKEVTKNKQDFIFNLAVTELIEGNLEKSLTILQSNCRDRKIRYSGLFCITNLLSDKLEEAEKGFKYRLLMRPNNKNFLNFGSFLHYRSKRVFQKNLEVPALERALTDLGFAENLLRVVSINTVYSVNAPTSMLNAKEIRRRKDKLVNKRASSQLFFLLQNIQSYRSLLSTKRETQTKVVNSIEERKRILEEAKALQDLQLEEKKRKEEEEKLQAIQKASEIEQMKAQFASGFNFAIMKEKKPKVKKERLENDFIAQPKAPSAPKLKSKKPKGSKRRQKMHQESEDESDVGLSFKSESEAPASGQSSDEEIAGLKSDSDSNANSHRKKIKKEKKRVLKRHKASHSRRDSDNPVPIPSFEKGPAAEPDVSFKDLASRPTQKPKKLQLSDEED